MAEDPPRPEVWLDGDSLSRAELERRTRIQDSVTVPAMLFTARTQLRQCEEGRRSPKDILHVAAQLITALEEVIERAESPEVFYTVDDGYITAVDTRAIYASILHGLEYPIAALPTTES